MNKKQVLDFAKELMEEKITNVTNNREKEEEICTRINKLEYEKKKAIDKFFQEFQFNVLGYTMKIKPSYYNGIIQNIEQNEEMTQALKEKADIQKEKRETIKRVKDQYQELKKNILLDGEYKEIFEQFIESLQ